MKKTILVPVDLSVHSAKVAERGLRMAKENDRVLLFHVVMDPSELAGFHIPHLSTDQTREELMADAKKDMERFVARYAPGTSYELAFGLPFKEILAAAKREKADTIVIGSHKGAGKLERLLVSHASEKVIRNAPCDVLLVPLPIESEEELVRRPRA